MPTPRELLDRLDSRHDELIRKLDELNAQIEAALTSFAKSRAPSTAAAQSADLPADDFSHRRAA